MSRRLAIAEECIPISTGKSHAIELALLVLLALLWGSSYLFLKVAVTEIPPVTLIALRVSGAAAILTLIMMLRREHFPRESGVWRMLFVQSFLNSTGAWVVLAWGQQYVDAGLASVLNSTSPIFVFVFSAIIANTISSDKRKLLGTAFGITGVLLIVGIDALKGFGDHITGQLACLVGAAMYAGAAIYGRRFSGLGPVVTSASIMCIATATLVPLSFVIDQPLALRPSLQAIMATAILSIFCTGLALLIYFRLIRTLGSLGVASQAYLRAGIGVMLGIVFLGESFSLVMGVGIDFAVAGIALINWPVNHV